MTLNMYVLADYIKCINPFRCFHTEYTDCHLKSATLFDESIGWLSNYVYIISVSDFLRFQKIPQEISVIVTSGQRIDEDLFDLVAKKCKSAGADILFLRETRSVPVVLNEVLGIFRLFAEWTIQLSQCFLRKDIIQSLGDCSLRFLRNPFGLYSSSFQILYFFEIEKPSGQSLFYRDDKGKYISDNDINELLLDPDFIRSWKLSGPHYYPPASRTNCCLYQNIGVEDRYIARIVINDFDTPFRESDQPILSHFCKFVSEAIRRYKNLTSYTHPAMLDETLLKLALSRLSISKEAIRKIEDAMNWHEKDTWFCAKVSSPSDAAIGSISNACIRLEDYILGSCAIQNGDDILLLINLRIAGKDRIEIISDIVYHLREYILKAGFSREFIGLHKLHNYYQQAEIAMQVGLRSNLMLWSFRFEDYNLKYLTEQCIQSMDPECLCHPGLLRLIEYDKANGREYTKALRVYLEHDRNVAQTIRKLYMQRATFLYQLNRIIEITEANFDQFDTRLHFLISYKMLDLARQEEEL